jgi:cytochrome c553
MGFHHWAAALSLILGAACATALSATEAPTSNFSWAFPHPPPAMPGKAARPSRRGLTVPGSARDYDEARIKDLFEAVDWFPNSHPAAPRPVLIGRKPDAMACGYCHLPGGQGRPENAALAELPATYIAEQVRDMRAGARSGADPTWGATRYMDRVAKGARADEVADAASYYSKLKYQKAFRLVEARYIPAVEPTFGVYRYRSGGVRERLGERIIEVPNDSDRFELRDNRPGYTIYIPIGAIARGRALAENGSGGRFPACASCHGAGLKGALGPPLAGRYPAYLFRQMLSFSVGGRKGAGAAPMTPVARQMKTEEMIDLAAYAASLKP